MFGSLVYSKYLILSDCFEYFATDFKLVPSKRKKSSANPPN